MTDTHNGVEVPGQGVYRGLLESAPDAIVVVDSSGVIRLVNRQTEVLFGYERAELLGHVVEVLVPQRIKKKHPDLRHGYFSNPGTRPMGAGLELTARRKDGTEFPVDISLSPLETEEGILVSAAVRDVTDRVTTEAARAALAEIVNSSEDAIVGKTLDGTITSWNPGAERLYGYRSVEIIGSSVDVLLRPEDLEAESLTLGMVARGETVTPYETRRVRQDATIVDVSVSVSPIRDARGTISGVASINRDISERKRSEETQGLLDSAPDAIVVLDSSGGIRLVNRRTEAVFGYARDELLGGSIELLLPEAGSAGPDLLRQYFVDFSERSPGAGFELTARRKDGGEFPIEVSLSPLQTEQGTLVSASIRDITERKRAQAEREQLESRLHQSERLESLGQLAGGIAHDFNNLLAAISNYAGLVQSGLKDAASSDDAPRLLVEIDEDVQQIRRATERAADLTRRLLAFSRRGVIKPKVIDLTGIVSEMEVLLRRTIGEHIKLVTTCGPGLWTVLADPSQIEQIVLNLVINARDAMREGGTLEIATTNLSIGDDDILRAQGSGDHVVLTVADSGAGMEDQVLAHAFEPFFTTKPTGEGTGLGLATVYGAVTQAGGWVNLYSEVGIGTTVKVYLPRAAGEAETTEPVVQPALRLGKGEEILLVEDEDFVRHSTMRMLTRAGYRVVSAGRPAEALELLATGAGADLLLTDIVMPGMSGKELAMRVQELKPAIKIVYMSGYTYEVVTHRGIVEPGVVLLEKPFSEENLLRTVRDVIEASR